MVASLNERERLLLQQLIVKSMYLGREYRSSAKNYEDFLHKTGVSLPFKLFYEYKYHNNMTPAQYETYITSLLFYISFDKLQILQPEEYVKQLIENLAQDEPCLPPMNEETKAQVLKHHVDLVKDMSDSEKQHITSYICDNREYAQQKLITDVQEIKKLNPELREIKLNLNSIESVIFLSGVISGYAPEDIEYFIQIQSELKNIDFSNQRQEEFEQILGKHKSPQFRIRPDRIDIILNEIKKQLKIPDAK